MDSAITWDHSTSKGRIKWAIYPIVSQTKKMHYKVHMNMSMSTEQIRTHVGVLSDRRGTGRFPVREEIRYKLVQAKSAKMTGTGITLNIGSGGILFTTEQQLPLGRLVEVSVNWPARLGGTCPLQFVATARIVRSEPTQCAVRIERYEFKTRAVSSLSAVAPENQSRCTVSSEKAGRQTATYSAPSSFGVL